MIILTTGGRFFDDVLFVDYILGNFKFDIDFIVHGGAKGADSLVENWAKANNVKTEVFRANWNQYGNSAGAIRNVKMYDSYRPDIVIAFPGGNGTAHAISMAKSRNISVIEFSDNDVEEFKKTLRFAKKKLEIAVKELTTVPFFQNMILNFNQKIAEVMGVPFSQLHSGGVIKNNPELKQEMTILTKGED